MTFEQKDSRARILPVYKPIGKVINKYIEAGLSDMIKHIITIQTYPIEEYTMCDEILFETIINFDNRDDDSMVIDKNGTPLEHNTKDLNFSGSPAYYRYTLLRGYRVIKEGYAF